MLRGLVRWKPVWKTWPIVVVVCTLKWAYWLLSLTTSVGSLVFCSLIQFLLIIHVTFGSHHLLPPQSQVFPSCSRLSLTKCLFPLLAFWAKLILWMIHVSRFISCKFYLNGLRCGLAPVRKTVLGLNLSFGFLWIFLFCSQFKNLHVLLIWDSKAYSPMANGVDASTSCDLEQVYVEVGKRMNESTNWSWIEWARNVEFFEVYLLCYCN